MNERIMENKNTPLNRTQLWQKVYGQSMKYTTLGLEDRIQLAGKLAPDISERILQDPDKIQNPTAYINKVVFSEVTKLKEQRALEEEKSLGTTPKEPVRSEELAELDKPQPEVQKDSPSK